MSTYPRKLCIFCSNIHSGGGLQVAISFITELKNLDFVDNVDIYISTEISENIDVSLYSDNFNFILKDVYGLRSILFSTIISFKYYRIFTLFGPRYTMWKCSSEIIGFAQPWILLDDNVIYKHISGKNYYFFKVKFFLQYLFFSYANILVSESEHVSNKLRKKLLFKNKKIITVHNALSNIYTAESSWRELSFDKDRGTIYLGYLTRAYLHKNIDILPSVLHKLNDNGLKSYKLVLTLTNSEFINYQNKLGDYVLNIGPIDVYQCPNFYKNIDGFIFPSLLECFSASPLESLYMEVPLFASNRDFVKDVCNDFAYYFNPLSSDSITHTVLNYFENAESCKYNIADAKNHALTFSSARSRANNYINILTGEH